MTCVRGRVCETVCELVCRCGERVARLHPEGPVGGRKKPFKDFQLRREILIIDVCKRVL